MRRFISKLIFPLLLLCSGLLNGQQQPGARFDDLALVARPSFQTPLTIPNPGVQVCANSAVITGSTCSPLATTYTDGTLTSACSNPNQVVLQGTSSCVPTGDSVGNYGFWVVPGDYFVCVTGAGTNGQCYSKTIGPIGAIAVLSANGVQNADAQTGVDACAKIANAIAAGPSTGVTVSALGLQGAQNCASNPFNGVTKPVNLYLGASTITITNSSACWSLPSNVKIEGSGRGITTLKLATGINSCFVFQNSDPTNGNRNISIRNMTIDGNALNQSPNEGAGQRTGAILFKNVNRFNIQFNEIKNGYNFDVEVQKGAQLGLIDHNLIDGTIHGSGVLIGNTPVGAGGSVGSEAYDMDVTNNTISNTQADCLFSTGSDTVGAYGTARIHFNNNHLTNCGDVSIEIGDSTKDSEANNNIISVAPSVNFGSISRLSNVVTVTVTCAWSGQTDLGCLTGYFPGSTFTVAGPAGFTGSFTVSTVNYTTNTVTWSQAGIDTGGGSGTLTRSGNLALLSRAGLNHTFKGNVVTGNTIAANQDCELSWRKGVATADNGPRDENVEWDNICNNMGRNGFSTLADNAGDVTQIQHKSKMDGTVGSDYVIGSNTLALRIQSGGYYSAGAAFAGSSFNQTNDLQFRPGTGNVAKFIFSATNIGLGISNADFTPATLLHTKSASGGTDVTFEQSVDGNMTVNWKNTVQSWLLGIRVSAGLCTTRSFLLRDSTNTTDIWCAATSTGNISQFGKTVTYNNIATDGGGLSAVRKSVNSTNNNNNIGSTLLYTVPAAEPGMYEFSCYVVITTAAGVSSTLPNCRVDYTDNDTNVAVGPFSVTAQTSTITVGTNSVTAANAATLLGLNSTVINCKAGTAINYSTNGYASNAANAMIYALHIKLVYLGN